MINTDPIIHSVFDDIEEQKSNPIKFVWKNYHNKVVSKEILHEGTLITIYNEIQKVNNYVLSAEGLIKYKVDLDKA